MLNASAAVMFEVGSDSAFATAREAWCDGVKWARRSYDDWRERRSARRSSSGRCTSGTREVATGRHMR